MTQILVSGLINIETTLRVEEFPVTYAPVRYPFWGVRSTASGVGYNLAKALTNLGDKVRFLSLVGTDMWGSMVQRILAEANIPRVDVLPQLRETAQSVIIYNDEGKRMIHVDLKDIQEQAYPADRFNAALSRCELAILCNVNWNRPFLAHAAKAGKPIATDVHTISSLDDPYNGDFMAAATILFMSDEQLPCAPEEWARRIQNRYGTPIIVIGLGRAGALLAVKADNFRERIAAVQTRPVVNTIGAGDALFSAFNHIYAQTADPYQAIQHAVVFASYKIGTTGAAEGFLTAPELLELARPFLNRPTTNRP
ncbi:MAG: carbohydrate kinase family protein [Anaerolineales bacterium]|nr:carbohydrate kinase family protein [Anaerolineales bacterium]